MAEVTAEYIKNKIDSLIEQVKITALKVIEEEAVRSIQKNFEAGGRPKWIASKKTLTKKGRKISGNIFSGSNTLIDSGNLSLVTAKADLSNNIVTLTTDARTRAYARIHQEGGIINHPGGTHARRKKKDGRSVFASKNRDTGKANKVDVSFSKPYQIKIPPRPYLVIPAEDYPDILRSVESRIKSNL